METWGPRLRQVPLVAVLCLALLGLWGLRGADPSGVLCDRIAPGEVVCQTIARRRQQFVLNEVAIASELCDKTPRGGVRFCHRLTLGGDGQAVTLPEVRTPLSGSALREQIQRFQAGEGSDRLSWSRPTPGVPLRSLAIGLLLAVAGWALWDVRWPPLSPGSLALDGAEESADGG